MQKYLFILCTFFIQAASGQINGGQSVFRYLDRNYDATALSIGNYASSLNQEHISMIHANPALLGKNMHKKISLNYENFTGGTNSMALNGAYHLEKWKTSIALSILYNNYGSIPLTDETGAELGKFKTTESSLNLYVAHKIMHNTQAGIALKTAYSSLYSDKATALAVDFGLTYSDTSKNFIASLVAKNYGLVLKNYTSEKSNIEGDLQLSFSKRLKYLPLKFHLTIHHLQKFDIRYNDPNYNQSTEIFIDPTRTTSTKKYTFDKMLRHLALGTELKISKAFYIRAGYNHLLRSEMKLSSGNGLTGYSMGLGIHLKKIEIDYGYQKTSRAASTHAITVQMKLSTLK